MYFGCFYILVYCLVVKNDKLIVIFWNLVVFFLGLILYLWVCGFGFLNKGIKKIILLRIDLIIDIKEDMVIKFVYIRSCWIVYFLSVVMNVLRIIKLNY